MWLYVLYTFVQFCKLYALIVMIMYSYIKTDVREVGCGCVDWIGLAQDRDRWRALVSAVMNLRVP
jgi:hypothetical protein